MSSSMFADGVVYWSDWIAWKVARSNVLQLGEFGSCWTRATSQPWVAMLARAKMIRSSLPGAGWGVVLSCCILTFLPVSHAGQQASIAGNRLLMYVSTVTSLVTFTVFVLRVPAGRFTKFLCAATCSVKNHVPFLLSHHTPVTWSCLGLAIAVRHMTLIRCLLCLHKQWGTISPGQKMYRCLTQVM